MRKIDLSTYEVERGESTIPYFVKDSLIGLMYLPELKLNFKDLLDNDRIAQKIKNSEDYVLLEDAEYSRVKLSLEQIQGFGRDDVEFVRRIVDAPEIEVVPK